MFVIMGASNHSDFTRVQHDYYATDPQAVEELLKVESFDKNILEPCCGEGHISKVLEENKYNVTSRDLYYRGYGVGGMDFFTTTSWHEDIITNPPYKYAKEFVEHSIKIIDDGKRLAMLLKIQFLESVKRRELFEENPPKYVYVFSKRANCVRNGVFTNYPSSAVCYCWYIWEKGFKGEPVIRWI
ncbi:NAD(P)-dependent oxidoreductase [Anaerococcus sp. Marseille-P3625]|uniref:NAD(P)-dependent oxidoreductase n=1 Tax=Anaerococcus sp. Marseille-P3625 TaxID=1977277 RepID=UPI002151B5B5|nr:NAD(P)-dependent oxidoreductase [Anaerococcus sp. Marseille-P3625]